MAKHDQQALKTKKKPFWGGGWERIRRWLDGEDPSPPAEETERQSNEWNLFFVHLAREVEGVMKREIFTPPGGPTYLPPEYMIYLSREDDQLWQGRKREALEEALQVGLARRARELVGDRPLKIERMVLTFGVDGTLGRGEVRVQPVWEEELPQTQVIPRRADPSTPKDLKERTLVRTRSPLFWVRYSSVSGPSIGSGMREPGGFSSSGATLTVGRGGGDQPVDLVLPGDLEISRRHIVLTREDAGRYRVACVGRNPIEIGNSELDPGEETVVGAGQRIRVGRYQLWIEEGERPTGARGRPSSLEPPAEISRA